MDGLSILRFTKCDRLRSGLRREQSGHLSVHQDAARADLRGARHERRASPRCWKQAGRTVERYGLRYEISRYRQSREEALEMRLRRVQREVQLSRGTGISRVNEKRAGRRGKSDLIVRRTVSTIAIASS